MKNKQEINVELFISGRVGNEREKETERKVLEKNIF